MKWSHFLLTARQEIKLISRNGTWQVFVFIALSGIVSLQVVFQCIGANTDWGMIASAAHMPYLNAYLFNIAQSLLIIFFITDFFQREKREAWNACIYTRPIENNIYLCGKVMGILCLYVIINIFSIVTCCLLNLLVSDAPFYFPYYLFYLFTLTLPSLCFLTGLELWLSGITGSRFFAQTILLVLWIVTAFFTPNTYGTLDFLGHSLPNMFSDISGHPNLSSYLLQRSIYLLIGIGLIITAVVLLHRKPNNPKHIRLQSSGGCLFIFIGIISGFIIEFNYSKNEQAREKFRKNYSFYEATASAHIKEHSIIFEQKKEKIFLKSDIVAKNLNPEPLTRIILFLNPGLKITSLREGDHPLIYTRDNQTLSIQRFLHKGDSVHLQIEYEGYIDENFCNIDQPKQKIHESPLDYFIFRFGQKNSFISDDFLLLTPYCIWYPTSIPPVLPGVSYFSYNDFTSFHLSVLHPRQTRIISQGKKSYSGKDTISFHPSHPIKGLSLCGGPYESKYMEIRNSRIELFYFKNHDFFSTYFRHTTGKDLQFEIQQNLLSAHRIDEFLQGIKQYDQQLLLLEIPAIFQKKEQFSIECNNRIQPGLVFLSELGIDMDINHFRNTLSLKNMLRNGMSETEAEANLFITWASSFLTSDSKQNSTAIHQIFGKKQNFQNKPNPYNILPMLHDTHTTLYSEKYPYLDLIIKLLLQEESNLCQFVTITPSPYEREARSFLQGKTIEEVLEQNLPSFFLREILKLKSEHLLDYLTTHTSRQKLFRLIHSIYTQYPHQITFNPFTDIMEDSLRINLKEIVYKWATCKHDGLVQIKDGEILPIFNSDLRMGKIKISNNDKAEELISCQISRGDSIVNHNFYLQPNEAKEVRIIDIFVFFKINTLSKNIPGNLFLISNPWTMANKTPIKLDPIPGKGWYVLDLPLSEFDTPKNEIIVDNEDSTCFKIDLKQNLIQKLWESRKKKYRDLNPLHKRTKSWTPTFSENAYGKYIKNYLYKSGGDGTAKIIWETYINTPGEYEVMVMVHDRSPVTASFISGGTQQPEKKNLTYHYTVYTGKEEKTIEITPKKTLAWVSLGKYHFHKGKVRTTLNDQGEAEQFIVADAVKWVRTDSLEN